MSKLINGLVFLLVCSVLGSCGGDDDQVPNVVIEDPDGVEINLTWTTASGDPLVNSNLDLSIWEEHVFQEQSNSADSFESLAMDNASYGDGEYRIRIVQAHSTMDAKYTMEVAGASVSKSAEKEGTVKTIDGDNAAYTIFKIRKEGDVYTVITP
jgi:hypothetical protein